MARKSDITFAMYHAESDEGMCKRDAMFFHAFNDNGLLSAARDANTALMRAVELGQLKSGALIAYSIYHQFGYDKVMHQCQRKSPNYMKVKHGLEWVQRDIKKI